MGLASLLDIRPGVTAVIGGGGKTSCEHVYTIEREHRHCGTTGGGECGILGWGNGEVEVEPPRILLIVTVGEASV